jgi:hypothetical protein
MSGRMLLTVLAAAAVHATWAEEPVPAPKLKLCAALNNRILGPRAADRPLPLLQGDPVHGLRAACAVSWSTLSPGNHALEVADCYQDSLLQLTNDAACGRGTGPLWISSRWVVTSAELQQAQVDPAICQKLDTGTWAGTRDFPLTCRPEKKDFEVQPKAASESPVTSTPAPAAAPAPK